MAMTTCRECGKDVSAQAAKCPHCGVDKPGARPMSEAKRELVGKLVFGAVAAAIALMFIGSRVDKPGDPAVANKRAAVDLCWQEHQQAKLTLPESAQRFAAQACVKLEDELNAMRR